MSATGSPQVDYILNGTGHGSVGAALQKNKFGLGALRPYLIGERPYIDTIENGKPKMIPVHNAPSTLRYDEWKIVDSTVLKAGRERLQAVRDLRTRGLTRRIPNAMGKTSIQWQTMTRITEATVSMNPRRTSEMDRPEFDTENIPLPLIHKDFSFDIREIEESRNGGMDLPTITAAEAAERVMEIAEKMLIGTYGTTAFGNGNVYGYINHPSVNAYVLNDPTDPGWTPDKTVRDILAMKDLLRADFQYGPFMVYASPGWDVYLDDDYSAAKGDNTLRQRIQAIRGIQGVETLDFLTGDRLVMVQMKGSTVTELLGFDLTTFRWQEEGPFEMRFKVAAMMVPLILDDPDGNIGIVSGAVP